MDLNNTYELAGLDARIRKFKSAFEAAAYQSVLSDARFKGIYASAQGCKSSNFAENSDDKISDAIDMLSSYDKVVEARGKDGRPISEGIAARWAEAVFTSEQKTISVNDAYSIESLFKNAQGDVFHPCAIRYVLHQLKEEFEKETKSTKHENALSQINAFKEKEYTFKFSKRKIYGIEELSSLEKKPSIIEKMNGYSK